MKTSVAQGLLPMRQLAWEEVLDIWRLCEAGNNKWEGLYRSRGFSSWEEWRETYYQPLGLPNKHWRLYRILSPETIVPSFICPPVRSLVGSLYGGKRTLTFTELAERPDIAIKGNILSLLERLPPSRTIIGATTDDGIVVIDGLHCCSAITIRANQGLPIAIDLTIALADYQPGQLPLFGGTRKT